MKRLAGNVYPRAGFSPKFWPDSDDFLVLVEDTKLELDLAYPLDRAMVENGYRSAIRLSLGYGGERLGSVLLASWPLVGLSASSQLAQARETRFNPVVAVLRGDSDGRDITDCAGADGKLGGRSRRRGGGRAGLAASSRPLVAPAMEHHVDLR
jgi:hypothetical protein